MSWGLCNSYTLLNNHCISFAVLNSWRGWIIHRSLLKAWSRLVGREGFTGVHTGWREGTESLSLRATRCFMHITLHCWFTLFRFTYVALQRVNIHLLLMLQKSWFIKISTKQGPLTSVWEEEPSMTETRFGSLILFSSDHVIRLYLLSMVIPHAFVCALLARPVQVI